MDKLPRPVIGETRVMSPEIVDISMQRNLVSAEIRRQMAEGASVVDEHPVDTFKHALKHGGAEGSIGAEFFYDETWYDTPPPPEKVEGAMMKSAGIQQQRREEQ